MKPARTVLVTGAAGHLGGEIVHRLVRRGHHVTALIHERPEVLANNGRPAGRVSVLRGDVGDPDLGLDRLTLARLAGAVGVIVHCAAATDFGLPESAYTALNVDAAANVLDLARRCDAGVVQLSTAYVCGEFDGTFTEGQLDIGQSFANPYERSKFRAEQLVRGAQTRWAVVRPGIVTGDYRTGDSRTHKHIYPVLKLIAEGKLRTLPGSYAATLALTPIGHVADTVAEVVERFDEATGYTFHAIGANTISLRAMSDVLAEYPSLRMADLVPPATFSPDDLDDIERGYFDKVGTLYTSYLRRRTDFDAVHTREILGLTPPPVGAGYLRRLLDACLRTGYLGGSEPTVGEVLAGLRRQRGGR